MFANVSFVPPQSSHGEFRNSLFRLASRSSHIIRLEPLRSFLNDRSGSSVCLSAANAAPPLYPCSPVYTNSENALTPVPPLRGSALGTTDPGRYVAGSCSVTFSLSVSDLTITYRTGIKNRLSTVEKIMPPNTVVPTEWRLCEPAPEANPAAARPG